jgi:hypothetical protein
MTPHHDDGPPEWVDPQDASWRQTAPRCTCGQGAVPPGRSCCALCDRLAGRVPGADPATPFRGTIRRAGVITGLLLTGLLGAPHARSAGCESMTRMVESLASARARGVPQGRLVHAMRETMSPASWDAMTGLIASIYRGDFTPAEARKLSHHFCTR